MGKTGITFLDKAYMLALILLPVLAQYQVGPLDLDVVLMAAFLFVFLCRTRYMSITQDNKQILSIIIYIIAVTIFNLLFGKKFSEESAIILRTGRYCLYLFVVFFMGNKKVSYESMMRMYRVVAYAASIYILIQAVFYYGAGIMLPHKIGGDSSSGGLADIGRLRSFYSEPAELGYNLQPFLVCSLFGNNYKKRASNHYIDAVLVTVAIVLSTSGQGTVTAIVVWLIWFMVRVYKKGLKAKESILLTAVGIAAVILYSTGILEFTLGRVDATGETGAINARSSGYESLSLLTPLQVLVGAGFGNYVVENRFGLDVIYEYVNYSSIAEFLFTLGIVGTIFWFVFFYRIFRKGDLCIRVLLVAMFVLSLFGCPMTGKHFPLWLTIMCTQLPPGSFVPANEGDKRLL